MKNIIKLSLLTTILVFATSCNVDQVGEKFIDGNRGVSFDNAKYTTTVTTSTKEINVHVTRVSAVLEETVGLTHNCTNLDIFSIPQTITFAEGEYEKNLKIAIDTAKIELGPDYIFNLKMEEKASLGGINETEITISVQIPWIENIGYSKVTSQFEGKYSDSVPTDSAIVKDNVYYRLKDCYYHVAPEWADAGYDIIFIVSQSGNVTVPSVEQNIGELYDDEYGYIYFRPLSATKVGRTVTFTARFTLPKVGLAFTNIFTEVVKLP
ncbi:MAG: hypothetical protein LBP63_06670 [Prevotellaceae bacterium]|jgi:hypothetical protein|nr:hypothetical protein [Prevotellaceae bacterium]